MRSEMMLCDWFACADAGSTQDSASGRCYHHRVLRCCGRTGGQALCALVFFLFVCVFFFSQEKVLVCYGSCSVVLSDILVLNLYAADLFGHCKCDECQIFLVMIQFGSVVRRWGGTQTGLGSVLLQLNIPFKTFDFVS